MNFKFTPLTIPSNIFVIGAGGTGGRLMPTLAQFVRTITRGVSPSGWVENPTIWLIDDDVVETKNLMRQNFIEKDVGKYKATVVAERYAKAFNVNIFPLLRRITSDTNDIVNFNTEVVALARANNPTAQINPFENAIIVICVDSAQARRDILNTFTQLDPNRGRARNLFFIDSGNEDSFGQVNFFHPVGVCGAKGYDDLPTDMKFPKLLTVSADINQIPMDIGYYMSLVDTESTASCADLTQTLAINNLMACNIMGVIQNFYYRKPFNFNTLRIDLAGANSTAYNTFNDFKSKSVSKEIMDAIQGRVSSDNPLVTTEKNGTKTFNQFARNILIHDVRSQYNALLDKVLEREKAKEEKRKREEAAAERAAAYKIAREEALARGETPPEEPHEPGTLKIVFVHRNRPAAPAPAPVTTTAAPAPTVADLTATTQARTETTVAVA
jgi:molybdopterin/thiamine biosynthesis adenylyltransferase